MHPVAGQTFNWLSHEACVQVVLAGDSLDNHLEGLQLVSSCQGIVEAEVDFLLAIADFVVGSFYAEAQLFQSFHDFPAALGAFVFRSHVEV